MSSVARAGIRLRAAGDWLTRTLVRPRLPLLAVEVRPGSVAAVRLAEGKRLALAAAVSTELPRGTLELSLTKSNIIEPASFRAALRATLERAGALSGGPVALVLPDPAVRVALIDAEGLRGRRAEAEETVRFRLHKALPFDVRGARLSWRLVGEQALVAVAPEEVLAGYEDALEELGFQPGVVEVTSLALAASVSPQSSGEALLVNWDDGYVSFLLLRQGEPVLVRTLPGESGRDTVARQASATLQFCRDRMGVAGELEVVVRSAAVPGEEALAILERALGCSVRLLEPWAALGLAERGEAAQAVAGAASSVLRSAA